MHFSQHDHAILKMVSHALLAMLRKQKKCSQNYRFIIWVNRRLENEAITVSVDNVT